MASDQLPVVSFVRVFLIAIVFGTGAGAQNVGNSSCGEEVVRPNLVLRTKHHVYGELNDPTGAAFAKSRVTLRRQTKKGNFVNYRTTLTDGEGHFDLKLVEPGAYRFLPATQRGWKQPKEVICSESSECEIKLVMEINPTDMPFAQCAIR